MMALEQVFTQLKKGPLLGNIAIYDDAIWLTPACKPIVWQNNDGTFTLSTWKFGDLNLSFWDVWNYHVLKDYDLEMVPPAIVWGSILLHKYCHLYKTIRKEVDL